MIDKDSIFLQNEDINSDSEYSRKYIFAGANVTDNITHGPVRVLNSNVILRAKETLISSDFEVPIGSTLEIIPEQNQ